MAAKKQPTPPIIHAKFDTPKVAPRMLTGVGDRGTEQNVPYVIDGAGRKFVGEGHPDCGKPW